MTGNKRVLGSDLEKIDAHHIDPEEYVEIPELDDDFFARADHYDGGVLVKRGRNARTDGPKRQVTIRLDEDVLDTIRATGPGWQTRLNDALREWIKKTAA